MAVSASSSVQQARQVIADQLREVREQAGLTGRAHARACGWDPAKTSRIEHNHAAPSVEDVRTWCRVCGVDDQADGLVESLRTVEGMFVEWQRMERSGLRHAQEAVRPLYERTRRFRSYNSWLVPGMLQTPAYTETVLRAAQRRRNLPDDVTQAVAVRLERQRLLTIGGRLFAFLLEESVLHSDIADSTTMAGQLHHLADAASLPSVSLGVIPRGVGRGHRPVEGFWIFDNAQVNVELVSGYLTVTQPREIEQYAKTFAELASMAVVGTEARALITRARSRLFA